ncbi:sporulation-specific glucan 1,3-beta-glucosidase [Monosporozyma servazzii]
MVFSCLFKSTLLLCMINYFNVVHAHTPLNSNQIDSINKKFTTLKNTNINKHTNDSTQIKGVSIGGWLVLEPYITPTLFNNAIQLGENVTKESFNKEKNSDYTYQVSKNITIIDEFTLCEKLGIENSKILLNNHFNTWITEDDFKQIAENGFNLVRIPIGYWAWKQNNSLSSYPTNITYKDPYVGEGLQLAYLQKAIDWATKYNLKIWIDLHGAPGSQNGFDNSGQRNFYSDLGWLADTQTKALTIVIWREMFDSFLNTNDNIIGIEIINEPLVPKINLYDVTQSYYEAFDMFKEKQSKNDETAFIIHDAFQSLDHWNLELNPQYRNVSNQYYNLTNLTYSAESVWVDHHHYEVFTDSQAQENQYSRITNILNYGHSINHEMEYHPAIVGEWSGAITDCAKWVNGLNVGARYDGSYYNTTLFTTKLDLNGICQSQNPISEWSEDYRISVRQFIEAQLATYDTQTKGWIFWNWKTENAPEWDYIKLRDADLFPTPFNNYTYFQPNGTIDDKFISSLSKSMYQSSTGDREHASKTKNIGSLSKQTLFNKFNTQSNLHMGWKLGLASLFVSISAISIFL